MSSTPSNKPTANFLLGVEFEIKGYTINGAFEATSGILAGRVDDINLKALAPDEIADFIPNITIDTVQAAYNTKTGSSYLKTDLGIDISLLDLPFIGSRIPQADNFGLSGLTLIASSCDGKTDLSLDADLNVAGAKFPLALPLTRDSSTSTPTPTPTPTSSAKGVTTTAKEKTKPGMVKWFDINKTIGSGQLKRVGLQYNEEKLFFMLDMQVAMGPLTIGLDGLSVGSPIDRLAPQFSLSGLSVSYAKGPTSISGAFLRDELDDSYQGLAVIKTPGFSIAAMGAYKNLNGQPSIFIYGVLNMSVGIGPPFLQLTGISAGFGYNRTLNIPAIDKINQFPLVSAAMGKDSGSDPLSVLAEIKDAVPAAAGELFVAFGIKFTSFKMIDAFALLTLRLGNKVRLDLLGLARVSIPNKVPYPLVVVELAIKASYDFDEKALKVQGELTSASYILSKKCRLTGGFAFYSWFDGEHGGDFVLTMGGYHPDFKVPSHYPTVPRLGFHWQLMSSMSLKGEMYYALVPGALMAGGKFEALFEASFKLGFDIGIAGATLAGSVKAYFIIGADFIIAWQPFSYDAKVYVSIGITAKFEGRVKFLWFSASKTLSFDLSLSANLHIWGPEFSGTAHVDWSVISFDIEFGANKKSTPIALTWSAFATAFLPPKAAICSISIADGLIRQVDERQNKLNIINPASLALTTNSVIPANRSNVTAAQKDFGVACMDVSKVGSSAHNITIVKNGVEDVTDEFEYQPITQKAPEALWGSKFETNLNGGLIDDLLMGCRITPKPKKAPDKTEDKPLRDFAYDIELKDRAYQWSDGLKLQSDDGTKTRQMVEAANTVSVRDDILGALGLASDKISLNRLAQGSEAAFLVAPQVVAAVA
jgi:hypothetical protein